MRDGVAVVSNMDGQVSLQPRHGRIVLVPDEDKDYSSTLLDCVGADPHLSNQGIIGRRYNRLQYAVCQLVGKAVIPASDSIVGQAGRPQRHAHATMGAAVAN